MNKEIKEILNKLKETADYPKINYSSYDKTYNETIDNVAMIKSFACKELLDYITNLQQENERLKETNKELKDSSPLDEAFYNGVHKLYDDYKSRCEKAIEYIEMVKELAIVDKKCIMSVSLLLNILQGSE